MDVRAVVATVLSALGIQRLVLPLVAQSYSIVYPVTEVAIVVGASIFFVHSAEYLWKKALTKTSGIHQAPAAAADEPGVPPPAESSNSENSSVAQLREDFLSLKKAFENQQKQVAKSLGKINNGAKDPASPPQQVPSQAPQPVNGKKNLSLGGASS